MYSEDEIFQNKTRYEQLVMSISREGFDKERVIEMLNNSDFFYAPASAAYHNDFAGGLCGHCLNVYDNMLKFKSVKDFNVREDSMLIVSLFHDFSYINYFSPTCRNIKHYCTEEEFKQNPADYKMYDELGNFKWIAKLGYTVNENRFIYGNAEATSEYLARCYIPLTREESIAILNHRGTLGSDSARVNIYNIYKDHPLAELLFLSEFTAMTIDEATE